MLGWVCSSAWLKAGSRQFCAHSTTHRSGVHEERALPAELLHRQLQDSRLRDGSLIDVQSSLRRQHGRRLVDNLCFAFTSLLTQADLSHLIAQIVDTVQSGVDHQHGVGQRLVL